MNQQRLLTEDEIRQISGLTQAEAAEALRLKGLNELPQAQRRNLFHILLEVLREPMFILLIACSILYFIMGDLQEAVMLMAAVMVMIGITLFQEGRTERSLQALKDLSSPRALVIREGRQERIAGRMVAEGDYIILSEGDRVPADALLLWGLNLKADESLLTGEAEPVTKQAAPPGSSLDLPGGDGRPGLFSGTLIVAGKGVALVKCTGSRTQLGKIGSQLRGISPEKTFLQKETSRIVRVVFTWAAILCACVILFRGLAQGEWLRGVLSGITLAMALIPEEFPMILTVFFALGAWRMSRRNVLTRKVSAIEMLGAATVLCSDKTGTLTQNRITLQRIFSNGFDFDITKHEGEDLPEEVHEVIEFGVLASQTDPFDPMEKSFLSVGEGKLAETEHLHQSWTLVRQYPLSRELMAMAHVWESPEGGDYIIAAKGAPEAVAELCHLSEAEIIKIHAEVAVMASAGLRVLGVAKGNFSHSELPGNQHDFEFEFVGLAGFRDPVRPEVPAAIEECYRAGMRMIMITGDNPVTAQNIARQIGLQNPEQVITGPEVEQLPEDELAGRLRTANIFARVLPEHKLRIVNLLKAQGEIVAMTGDGVNDAPALKSSHIGIAMGGRGTDVAREASALVLVDDSFTSIVTAVKQGRTISDNLKKAMAYVVSIHLPIAGAAILPLILGWKMDIFTAVHIVFLELVIDPTCSIAFEAEPSEKNVMSRPPRKKEEPIFRGRTLLAAVLQGLFALLVVVAAQRAGMMIGHAEGRTQEGTESESRALAFAALILSNIALVFVNRSWNRPVYKTLFDKNRSLWWVSLGTLATLGAVIYVPGLGRLFHFNALHYYDLAIAFGLSFVALLWFEMVKWLLLADRNRQDKGG